MREYGFSLTRILPYKDKIEDLPASVDLSKLIDVVKNDVTKKDACNANVKSIADKLPDITDLATNTSHNAKINKVKGEIPNITELATTSALNAKKMRLKAKYLRLPTQLLYCLYCC